jgi:hypothetical protein
MTTIISSAELSELPEQMSLETSLTYYNNLWIKLACGNEDFNSKSFNVLRSNGQTETDWKIYDPKKMHIANLSPIAINNFTNDMIVILVKLSDNDQYITKGISMNDLKKQVFEKKYSLYGECLFLRYFPDYIYVPH